MAATDDEEEPSIPSKCRRYCSVPNCRTRQGKMYYFPKNKFLREEWRLCCGITRDVSNSMNVCSRHFSSADQILNFMGHIRLRPGARPSLFLRLPGKPKAAEEREKGWNRCIVPSCDTGLEDPEIAFHCCPRSEYRRKEWQEAIGLRKIPTRWNRICARHFSATDFFIVEGKPKLRRKVIPSLFLSAPDSESTCDVAPEESYEEPLFLPCQDIMAMDDCEEDPLFIPEDNHVVKQELVFKHESDVEL